MKAYSRSKAREWAAARIEETDWCRVIDVADELEGDLTTVEESFDYEEYIPMATIAWWRRGSGICRVMRRTPLPRG